MRALFSIAILITFALKPAMEISTVLYYQLNIDYIVENYCINKERPMLKCDGKCYLAKQMQSIDTSENSEKSEKIAIVESFIPLFYQEVSSAFFPISIIAQENEPNWGLAFLQSFDYYDRLEQPPIS